MRRKLLVNRQIWVRFLCLLMGIGSVVPAYTQLWMKGGHGGIVWQTIFSTDQRFLLSAGGDNTIKVWNANRSSPRFGHLLGSVRAHVAGVASIAEYNGLVVSGGGPYDNQVKLWRLTSTGKLNFVRSWATPGYGVSAVAFTNWIVNNTTKRIIVAGTYGGFLLIDQQDGATLWYRFPWMPGEPVQWVTAIAVSRDRAEFAVGTDRGKIYVIRPSGSGSPIREPDISHLFNYGDSVYAVSYDVMENFLLAGGRAGLLRGWNLSTSALVFSVPFQNSTGGGGWIWSIRSYTWSGGLALRQYFAVSGWTSARPTIVTYSWDTTASPPSSCGEFLNTSVSGITYLRGSFAFTYPPIGNPYLYAVGREDGAIEWWEIPAPCADSWNGLESPTIYYSYVNAPIRSVAFSHDDTFIASGADGKVHVWDINGNLIWQNAFSGRLWQLAFSPTEHRLVIAYGGTAASYRWDGSTFAPQWSSWIGDAEGGLAFSPDGARILIALNGQWRVLDASDGSTIHSQAEQVSSTSIRLLSCAWSPDNAYLAVGRADGKVRIYNASSYALFREFRVGSYMNPTALAFATVSGRLKLFVGTTTGKLQQWDVASGTKESESPLYSERITSLHVQGDWMAIASTQVPDSITIRWLNSGEITLSQETGVGVWTAALSSRVYSDISGGRYRYLAFGRHDATVVLTTVRYIPPELRGGERELEVIAGGEKR